MKKTSLKTMNKEPKLVWDYEAVKILTDSAYKKGTEYGQVIERIEYNKMSFWDRVFTSRKNLIL